MLKSNTADVIKLEKELQTKSKELSTKVHKSERQQINAEIGNINNELSVKDKLPFELYTGFIVCIIFFSFPLIIYAINSASISWFSSWGPLLIATFFIGIMFFVLLFILLFVRLNDLVMQELETVLENSRKQDEENEDRTKVEQEKRDHFKRIYPSAIDPFKKEDKKE